MIQTAITLIYFSQMEKYFAPHCDRRGINSQGRGLLLRFQLCLYNLFLPNHKLAGCYGLVIANRNINAPVIYVSRIVMQNHFERRVIS